MKAAHEFPKRILLVAAGLAPQVITETIYALTQVRQPPWYPTEVHLLTTSEGAERARLALLSTDERWFYRLCEEYDIPVPDFSVDHIQVLRNHRGEPLSDLRTEEDNAAAADAILECVRTLTADEDSALHVSLAGGRKTMSYYLGYALSLYGRPQDQLSHVLVDAPYESHPGFFFPSKRSRVIYTAPPDVRPLDTSRAQVRLAEIPFLRLRGILPPQVLQEPLSFEEVVRVAQSGLGVAHLALNLEEGWIEASGTKVRLAPVELAFLAMFARRALRGAPPVECPSEGCDPELAREFLAEYERIANGPSQGSRTKAALAQGMPREFFLQHKARLRKALQEHLGWRAAAYEIRASGQRPYTTYQLELKPDQIRFLD